jgi:hypothetical protein
MTTIITGDLVRKLANSPAMDPALVRYDSDGTYEVRSTIRDANGLQPGNGYQVVATKDDLISYLDGFEFAESDADTIAAAWQAYEVNRQQLMTTYRSTFTTEFEQYADREGQRFEVLRVITTADATHDAEVLPMYRIRFPDGFETDAWPEEVIEP